MPLRCRSGSRTGVALACLALSGCIETHLYSGRAPGEAAKGFDERWHSSYLFGTMNAGWSYKLDTVCPRGWSEISQTHDTLTSALSLGTLFLYTPSRVTIVCAREPEPSESPRELELYPPPASHWDE